MPTISGGVVGACLDNGVAMQNSPKQETVTLESLKLLKKTVDYLKRLPLAPATRHLIAEIDAHLGDPNVAAAHREAHNVESLAVSRVAQWRSPGGSVRLEVVVNRDEVTVKVPPNAHDSHAHDRRMRLLSNGIILELRPLE
jgi:hypothetical protein